MITVFHGAGGRSTLQRPKQLFSLGCGPFLFRKKEMVRKKPILYLSSLIPSK